MNVTIADDRDAFDRCDDAGDAFAAGYLHALIQGRSERERLVSGHAAAGRVLVTTGDVGAGDVDDLFSGSDRLL